MRKYFKTQLTALGVPSEYVEYMMGHKISTYHDVKMRGVEFLRNVYKASNLSIGTRTKMSRSTMLKEIMSAWGYDPEKVLVKEVLAEPHRTVCAEPSEIRDNEARLLSNALKEMLRKELLPQQSEFRVESGN